MRVLRDLRRLVVADVAVQGRHLHEVDVQVVLDLLVVRLDAVRAVRVEGHASVAQQADGLQDVPRHDGLEDVELEVALRAGEADRRVVAEHLGGDHRHGLALGRVDLARHDGRARLVLGDDQLADAVTRTRRVPTHVVRDLHEGVGQDAQRARNQHQRVVRAQGGEQVVGLLELDARLLGDLLRGELAELRVSVQAGAHGGATDGQLARTRVRVLDAVEGEVDLSNPAGDDLAQADRGRVLQVGAAHHDDVVELLGLLVQGVAQLAHTRVHVVQLGDDRDVHGGGEGVVRGLAAVHVVVGVHGGLGAHGAAREFDGAVGDNLVGVHVRLRARAGLEDDQREVVVELTGDDLVAGLRDVVRDVGGQLAQLGVGQGCGLLQDAEGAHHRATPHECVAADVEVVQRTLGLSAPIAVRGDLNGSHRVGFGAGFLCHRWLLRVGLTYLSRIAPSAL